MTRHESNPATPRFFLGDSTLSSDRPCEGAGNYSVTFGDLYGCKGQKRWSLVKSGWQVCDGSNDAREVGVGQK